MEKAVRQLPEHYARLCKQLGRNVISCTVRTGDIQSLGAVRLFGGQNRLTSELVYIGSQRQLLGVRDLYVYRGAAVIACEAERPLLAGDPRFSGATVLETASGTAAVYNALSRILTESDYAPPVDTRGGLNRVWNQILSSKLLARQDIYDALVNSGLPVNTFFRVATVVFLQPRTDAAKFNALRTRLERLIPGTAFVARNKTLTTLLFSPERAGPAVDSPELRQTLEEYGAVMMIGHQSRDYSMVRTLCLICQRCLEVAVNMDGSEAGPVYDINDYAMYYAIDLAAQRCGQIFGHLDILLLVHPSAVVLHRYDQANDTDLLSVLENYLLSSGSVAKTAERMYVHRNTINNKLSRIRQLLDLDLEDGSIRQLLLFSCQTLRYYERFLNGQIRP